MSPAHAGLFQLFGNDPMSQPAAIVLRSQDDVAVAARRLEPGEDLDLPVGRIPVRDLVGMGHKIALRAISSNAISIGSPLYSTGIPPSG